MAVRDAKTITYNIEITEKGFVELTSEATNLNKSFSAIGDSSKNFSLALKAITKDVQKNTEAHGRTVNAINAEIKAVEELQNSFAKNNKQYRSAANRIKALQAEKKKLIDTSSKEIRQELTLEQQIAELNDGRARTMNVIQQEIALRKQLRSSTANNNEAYLKEELELQRLEQEYDNLTKTQSRVSIGNKSMSKGLGNVKSATGSASGAVVELGRTISDSNYGFPAMANNVQQLATQFTFVVAEQGGVVKGFKSIGKAMRGVGGMLLLFTIGVTLLEKFALNSRKVKDESDGMAEAIGKAGSDLRLFLDATESGHLSGEQLSETIKNVNEKYKDLNISLDENGKLTKESKKQIDNKILSLMKLAKANALATKAEEAYTDLVELEIKKEEDLQKIREDNSSQFTQNTTLASGGIKSLEEQRKEVERNQEARVTARETRFEEEKKEIQERLDFVKKKLNEEDLFKKTFENGGDDVDDKGDKGDSVAEKRNKLLDLLKDYQDQVIELGAENEQQLLNIRRNAALKEAEELGAEKEDLAIIEKYYDKLSYDLFLENIEKRKKDREKDREKEIQDAKDLAEELTTIMSERFKEINRIITSVSSAFDSISKISQSYHEGEIQRLQRERDFVQNNTSLSESEKLKSLERIKKEEEKAQIRKIKAEQTFLMIQQGVLLAETIMNAKKMIMEKNILLLKLATMSAEANAKINISAVTNMAEGKMSIGTFFSQLGVGGGIAFAAAIGGIIATIVSAKKQAQNQIASLTGKSAPSSGGGGSVSQPDFNIVGASPQSQLAQTIAEAEQQPTRAYVVAEDVTSAQQLDRETIQGASLG